MSRTYRRKNLKSSKYLYWADTSDPRFNRDCGYYANKWSKHVKWHSNKEERAYIRNSLSKAKIDYDYDVQDRTKYYKGIIWHYD